MIENDNQNSQQAASAAVRNAPKLAKIAQAGVQGGPAGAAAEAAVQYRKEVLVVAIAVMLLPVLVLIMLPGAIFGTLTQPSTAVNDDLEIAANVIQLRNAVSDILQEAYEDTLAEIESERASRTYSDIDDSVGGHVSYNAFQLISMYCAYQGEDDYTKISLSNLSEQIQAHRTEYYTYTISEEVRTEPVQKEVRGQTITVQEDHTYTIFTLSYVGDDYFADTVWQLDDKQKSYADAYAHNLTVYLHEIEEREGITILGQINDSLIDDNSPAPSGGFGNPFNDPNWEQHITSFFGKREDVGIPGKDTTNHNGLDIAYPYGTPILAVEAGTVIKAGYHVSYGNYLVIKSWRWVLYALCPLQPAFGAGWRYGEQVRHHCQGWCYRRCNRKSSAYLRHYRRCLRQPKRVSALKQGGAASANTQERPSYFYLSEQYRQVISSAVQHTENFYSVVFPVHTVENQLL